MKLTVDFYVMQAMYQLAADRRQERQKKRVIAKVCVWFVQKRRLCTDSTDDICISHLEFIEDAYSNDDICIERIEYPGDAGNKKIWI